MSADEIWFLATGKSGLGHLRRVATIARAVRALSPGHRLVVMSNAALEGLSRDDMAVIDRTVKAERGEMAGHLASGACKAVVLDTLVVPGLADVCVRRALVLREMPGDRLQPFREAAAGRWDQVIVANPAEHWMPDLAAGAARRVTPVGWIYRPTGVREPGKRDVPRLLVATGGGGTEATARDIYDLINRVIGAARRAARGTFSVVQAIGPRARAFGTLCEADSTVDPGGDLNLQFRDADAVISTSGYNSVLELATTDTPTLLLPIARSIDDQAARAALWGRRLGMALDAGRVDAAGVWLADVLASRRRRPAVDLGPSGEGRAAELILELT